MQANATVVKCQQRYCVWRTSGGNAPAAIKGRATRSAQNALDGLVLLPYERPRPQTPAAR